VISTFQIAESMGFKGEFRHWELLKIHPQTVAGIGGRIG
jgi:hypothetical protein